MTKVLTVNNCSLVGVVKGTPFFDWLRPNGKQKHRQAFLQFYLHLQGPRAEKPTLARVVVYGEDAEFLYPRLKAGQILGIIGRYRKRKRYIAGHVHFEHEFVVRDHGVCLVNEVKTEVGSCCVYDFHGVKCSVGTSCDQRCLCISGGITLETLRIARSDRALLEQNPGLSRPLPELLSAESTDHSQIYGGWSNDY